jgi:uncharacterized protein (DUF952 family)
MTNPDPQRTTLHLCPRTVWEGQQFNDSYLPEAYEADGFIHCTDGDERMISVANRFYASDPRDFVVLRVDLTSNGEPWVYEDPEQVFPHIYGPIHPSAVLEVRPIVREPSGLFISVD